MTREILTPSPIPNVTVTRCAFAGCVPYLEVKPNEGYMLHDKARDCVHIDFDTHEERKELGHTTLATCSANYDFTPVAVTDENGVVFTAYGSREFAARIVRK